jgi:Protein of unknown function (DUF4231)
MDENHATWERLEDQITWYDGKSRRAQRMYKGIQAISVAAAAAIPIVAPWSPWQVAAILGSVIAVLQALQALNQYQHNWITYRSTCEELKHEKYLFLAKAGPYEDAIDPDRLLAERIEETVSQEHAKWVAAREKPEKDRTR